MCSVVGDGKVPINEDFEQLLEIASGMLEVKIQKESFDSLHQELIRT